MKNRHSVVQIMTVSEGGRAPVNDMYIMWQLDE